MGVGVSILPQFPPYLSRIILRHMFYMVYQSFHSGLSFSGLIICPSLDAFHSLPCILTPLLVYLHLPDKLCTFIQPSPQDLLLGEAPVRQ